MNKKSHRIVLIGVLLAVLIVIAGGWICWYVAKQSRQSVESELQAVAQLKMDQIVAWRSERMGDADVLMNSIGRNEEIASWIKTRDPSLEEKILRGFIVTAKAYQYDRVILVGPDGQVLLNSSGRVGRISPEEAQAMASALRDQKPAMTDLYLDPDTSSPRISIISPPPTSDGVAIILVADPEQFLYPMIQSWPVPRQSHETFIVRRDGDRALFLNELRNRKDTALKLGIPLTQVNVPAVKAVLGKKGMVTGPDDQGHEVLAFLSPIKDTPWFMISKIDTREAYASSRLQSAFILLVILLFLAVILFSTIFACLRIKKERTRRQIKEKINQLNGELEQKNQDLVEENRERMKAMEAAQRFSERLQIATRAARIGIWDWNIVDDDLIWDNMIYELYGVSQGGFIGGVPEWREYIHPDDRSQVDHDLQAALRGEQEYAAEFRIIWPDGSIHNIQANSQVFWDGNGKPIRMVGTNIDITENKQRAEEAVALKESLDSVAGFVFSKNIDLKYISANRLFCDLLKIPYDKIQGMTDFDIFPADLAAKYIADDQRVIETAEPITVEEETINSNTNQRFIVQTRKFPRFDKNGRVAGIYGVGYDITNLKQAEYALRESERIFRVELEQRVQERTAQLTEANHELEAFSYSVSHDLRAPLRAVDGFSRMLMEDYADRLDEEGQRKLKVIYSEAQRMGRLIDDLLTFSRLGRQETKSEPIDMGKLVQEIYNELIALGPTDRKLKLDLQPLPMVVGTKTMIRQVWTNLIDNAIKFTKDREVGKIEISAQPGEDGVPVFSIKDNGAGFDMSYADKLFRVFERLHSPDEFPGTGVGLAFVQRIVIRHGGRIWAVGEVDQGATFYFTLPNL